MKLLTLLTLILSLVANAQPPGGEPYALYGCFHNNQAYAATMNAQTCPSLPTHTHVKDSYIFSYATTGTLSLRAFQSRAFTSISVTPLPTLNYPGDPNCIISKKPLVE